MKLFKPKYVSLFALSFLFIGKLEAQKLSARDHFMQAAAAYRCNACQPALEAFSRAIVLDYEYANAYMGRSLSHLCLKNFDGALADIRRAMNLQPNEPLFVHTYGRIRQARGDLRGALIEFTKATDMDDQCWQAWYSRGEVLVLLHEPKKAIDDLDRALSNNPDCGLCWYEKGKAKLKEGLPDASIEFLDKAVEMLPLYADVWYLKGLAYSGKRDWESAIADITRAINLDSKNSAFFTERAKAYLELKDNSRAIQDLEIANKLNPKNSDAWYHRAKVMEEYGEPGKAVRFYNRSIRRDPTQVKAFLERSNLHMRMNKKEKALADLEKAVDLDAGNLQLRNRVGMMKYELGEAPTAFVEFKYVLRQEPNNPDALYGLGLCHFAMGRKKQACEAWSMAAEKGQDQAVEELKVRCND